MCGIFTEKKEYAVLTCSSENTPLSWLHRRMPFILRTEESVRKWMGDDWRDVIVRNPVTSIGWISAHLSWYRVSTYVNSVRHNGSECCDPLDETKEAESKEKLERKEKRDDIRSFFLKRTRKSVHPSHGNGDTDGDGPPPKREKRTT
jgi:hypothetical protein